MPPPMTREVAVTDVGGERSAQEVLVGRYRLVRQLGRGGMGTVDLADDLVLDRRVAVKRLRDLSLQGGQARQRVLHEARALAALNHPGVAAIYDVLDLDPPALVLEYVEGTTWDDWVEQGQTPAQLLAAVERILEAVAYAHGRGVVHCDLKPSNIVVADNGVPKVLDFGIAQLGLTGPDSAPGTDETRQPAFTPKWAAPEVQRGRRPTPAADVYALGVMIEDLPIDCTRAKHPLPTVLARQLRHLGRRAQAESPDTRPADAAALLRELPRLAASGAPVVVRHRRSGAFAITALLVGGGCVTGGLAIVRGDRGPVAPGTPVLAVVPRVDAASASSTSAAAADLLRQALRPLGRARLVTSDVPALTDDTATLVEALKDEGLSHVLVPTVATMRSTIRLSVAVLRASDGAVVHTATRFGAPDALPHLAALVAGDVRTWLGEGAAARPQTPAFAPTALSLGQYSQARQYAERPDLPGNLARAVDLLEQTVRRDPAYAAAHAELGRVHWLRYRATRDTAALDAAQLSLLEALTREAHLPETRTTLALLMRERGRYPDAARALHDVLETAPDDDVALRLLGELEAQQGSVDDGVTLITRAVTLRPGSWANHRALGATLFNAGRYPEAGRSFEVLTQLQPDNPWGFQMLGAARQMAGNLDGAVQPYERSLAIRRTAAALSNLATVQYVRGDFAVAERLYREAVTLSPRDAVMHRNVGDALLRQSKKADAARAFTQAAELARAQAATNPADARALGTAAYALARLGQCGEAASVAATAERLGSLNPSVAANLANAWALCDRPADALRIVRALKARGAPLSTLLEHDVLQRLKTLPEFGSFL